MVSSHQSHSVGIGGLGTVGFEVARRIDGGEVDGLTLSAVSARDRARARDRMRGFRSPVDVVVAGELAERADIVVESAPAAVFREIAEPVVRAGKVLVAISAGALLDHADLVETARATGAQIVVPSGAVMGLDAVRGAAESGIASVTMITRKPPGGLAGAPHLVEHGIDVEGLRKPLKVFEGSARDGARGFPANVNVAAALGLAGVGPAAHPARDLGRPRSHPQHPRDPARSRHGPVSAPHRERPERREPAHRPVRRAQCRRRPAPVRRAAGGRYLRPLPGKASHASPIRRTLAGSMGSHGSNSHFDSRAGLGRGQPPGIALMRRS